MSDLLSEHRRESTINVKPKKFLAGASAGARPTHLSRATLKAKYLECLRARSPATLRQTVEALIHQGVRRDLLFAWAVADGNEKKRVSKILSECFCALGIRRRRVGAGRRISPPALLLLAFAHEIFGEQRRRCLRAACRAAGNPNAQELAGRGVGIIPVPELYAVAVQRFGKKLAAFRKRRINVGHEQRNRQKARFVPSDAKNFCRRTSASLRRAS